MPSAWTPELVERIRSRALASGFDLAGVSPAHPAEAPEATQTAARFTEWIDLGRAGEMDYLKRRNDAGELLRNSARTAIPWARSILVCALNYNAPIPNSIAPAPPQTGWIARYAQSGDAEGRPVDYHDDMLRRLREVESALQSQAPCQSKCYVDTGPLLERDFAARAGIGWTGKNTCVLNQQLGSWLLLGVLVTSLPVQLDAVASFAPDRCGSCTRCIDACPTDALVAPRQMDASLCIAYLTIEKKGVIPLELRESMGRQVFGCDICQDVCPWNHKATPPTHEPGFAPRPELLNPKLEWLAALDEPDQPTFRLHFKGSPLERTKRHRLHRNVAIAMGNSADTTFLPRLQLWSQSEDPILAESAQWALARLDASPKPPASMDKEPKMASGADAPHGFPLHSFDQA